MINGIECAFAGRVGNDPDLKTSQAGKPWLRLNVAVTIGDDATQWIQVACFGDRAQDLAGRLHKGDRVYVEGRLTLRTWEKDGESHAGLSVAAWKIERMGEIGRNRPAKPKAPPEGNHHDPPAACNRSDREHTTAAAARDWQAPADAEIPFRGNRRMLTGRLHVVAKPHGHGGFSAYRALPSDRGKRCKGWTEYALCRIERINGEPRKHQVEVRLGTLHSGADDGALSEFWLRAIYAMRKRGLQESERRDVAGMLMREGVPLPSSMERKGAQIGAMAEAAAELAGLLRDVESTPFLGECSMQQ